MVVGKTTHVMAALLALVLIAGCGGQTSPEVTSDPGPDPASGPDAGPTGHATTGATESSSPRSDSGEPPTTSDPEHLDPQPPPATLTGEAGTLVMEQGSYCWTDDDGGGICADTIGPGEQTPAFDVSRGETIGVAFDIGDVPNSIDVLVWPVGDERDRTQTSLGAANPTSYDVTLEPGSYFVVLVTEWDQGDASYHVRLDVGPSDEADR